MTAIGDLAALLAVHGLSADVVRSIVDLAQQHALEVSSARPIIGGSSSDVVRSSADSSHERRKEYDRKRQAEIRRLKRLSEKTPLILTSSSKESIQDKEESKKERRAREKKRLGPLPENWQPPDIAYALAADSGTTVPIVEAIFRDYLKSSGKLYADHNAAFCNFVRNQSKFNGNHGGKANGKAKIGIIQAVGDLRRKLASFDGPSREPDELRGAEGGAPVRLLSHG